MSGGSTPRDPPPAPPAGCPGNPPGVGVVRESCGSRLKAHEPPPGGIVQLEQVADDPPPPRRAQGLAEGALGVARVEARHLGAPELAERDGVAGELIAADDAVAAVGAGYATSGLENELRHATRVAARDRLTGELCRPPVGLLER